MAGATDSYASAVPGALTLWVIIQHNHAGRKSTSGLQRAFARVADVRRLLAAGFHGELRALIRVRDVFLMQECTTEAPGKIKQAN